MLQNRTKKLKRNIPLFYANFVFGKTGFWLPVLYFFLVELKSFNTVQALLLISVISLSQSVFEVPTGVVADKVSRRASVAIGMLIKAVCMSLLLPVQGFVTVFLCMAGIGLGKSFTSGADKSILYDTLKELGEKKEYKKQLNLTSFFHFMMVGTTTLIGGLTGQIDLAIPILLSSFSYIIATISSLSFVEPKKSYEGEELSHENYLTHTKEAFRLIFSRKAFLGGVTLLFIASTIMGAVLTSNKNIIAPVFEALSVNIAFVGIATSIIYFTKSIGAYIASRLNKDGGEFKEISFGLIIYMISLLFLFAFQKPVVGIVVFALFGSMHPLINSNFDKLINDRVPSNKRATVLSMQSLIKQMLATGFLAMFGVVLSTYHLGAGLIYIISIIFVVLVLFVINRKLLIKQK